MSESDRLNGQQGRRILRPLNETANQSESLRVCGLVCVCDVYVYVYVMCMCMRMYVCMHGLDWSLFSFLSSS